MVAAADGTPSRREIGGIALEELMSNTLIAIRGLDSMRETLRMSVILVLGMAVGAFILGLATPLQLTPKAMIADQGDAFSGRLVTSVAK
jgi:hypothetical protein